MPRQSTFDYDAARSLVDRLLTESRLYRQSKDYRALLDFVVRLRNFAPFNAMLLQLQKPGLSYAASARDWQVRFGRKPKDGARPLLILWPFGPVALVYDVIDTEGKELPQDVASFFATGPIDASRLASFLPMLADSNIEWRWVDAGDRGAGSITVLQRAPDAKTAGHYRIHVNRNHDVPVQFATLAHELAHMFLGHLGPDKKLSVPERPPMDHVARELEAESAAYLVCARNGVASKSETYLKDYVDTHTTVENIDLYQVMRAAGQVETLLELTAHTRYDPPSVARPVLQQPMLFPSHIRDVVDTIGLEWGAAVRLHDDGLLTFDPNRVTTLDQAMEDELWFLGSLVAAGCDPLMLKRLLDGLARPYRYDHRSVYYDWSRKQWLRFPPAPRRIEDILNDWLSELVGKGDEGTLQWAQACVDQALQELGKATEGRRDPPG